MRLPDLKSKVFFMKQAQGDAGLVLNLAKNQIHTLQHSDVTNGDPNFLLASRTISG